MGFQSNFQAETPFFIIGNNDVIIYINNDFVSLTGYSIEDLKGKSLSEISRVLRINPQGQIEDLQKDFSCHIFTKSYELIEVKISCECSVHNKEKKYYFKETENPYLTEISYLTEIFKIEISKEIKARQAVEKSLKIKEEFFSNVSHELKTPINVIFAAIQMLEYNMNSAKSMENGNIKYVKMMKQNSFRLLKLVNNLTDISKIESGYFKMSLGNHNIVSIIEEITLSVIEYAGSKGIEIIFDTDNEEKIAACDPDIIERVMLNLISNALKFTSVNGKIYINVNDLEDRILISVKDTGVGIPEDKQKIIFERFRQVGKPFIGIHGGGSGIGLSLVKLLVEMLNGAITVSSKINEGSEFIIVLPVKLVEESNINIMMDVSSAQRNVDRINIEFSDIYCQG